MKFSPSFLDEIRARLPLSEVVGQSVKLKKEGREWRGLSPFNAEKTPSFYVNDQKGFYYDFSSGKNGDIFNFLMETAGPRLSRGGGAAGRRWLACAMPVATPEARGGEKRRATTHRSAGTGRRSFFERQLRGAGGRQGPRLSGRARPRRRGARKVPARLCAGRTLRPARLSRRQRLLAPRHDRGRAADPRPRHPRAL